MLKTRSPWSENLLTQASPRILVMAHGFPSLSAYNEKTEPWRLIRLAHVADELEQRLPRTTFLATVELVDHKDELTVIVQPKASDGDVAAIEAEARSVWETHCEHLTEVVRLAF